MSYMQFSKPVSEVKRFIGLICLCRYPEIFNLQSGIEHCGFKGMFKLFLDV